jgi:hypothetical protein
MSENIEGRFYVNVNNPTSVFRFDGVYYHTHCRNSHSVIDGHLIYDVSLFHDLWVFVVDEYETLVEIQMDKEPSFAYTKFKVYKNGKFSEPKGIRVRKSPYRNMCEYKACSGVDFPVSSHDIMSRIHNLNERVFSKCWLGRGDRLFRTEQEAKDCEYSYKNTKTRMSSDRQVYMFERNGLCSPDASLILSEKVIQKFKVIDRR